MEKEELACFPTSSSFVVHSLAPVCRIKRVFLLTRVYQFVDIRRRFFQCEVVMDKMRLQEDLPN